MLFITFKINHFKTADKTSILKILFGWNFAELFYKTALHIAVKNKDIEIIKILLKSKKTNINIKDDILLLFVSSYFIN